MLRDSNLMSQSSPKFPADADRQPGFRTVLWAILNLWILTSLGRALVSPVQLSARLCDSFFLSTKSIFQSLGCEDTVLASLQVATAKSPTVEQPSTKKQPLPHSKVISSRDSD